MTRRRDRVLDSGTGHRVPGTELQGHVCRRCPQLTLVWGLPGSGELVTRCQGVWSESKAIHTLPPNLGGEEGGCCSVCFSLFKRECEGDFSLSLFKLGCVRKVYVFSKCAFIGDLSITYRTPQGVCSSVLRRSIEFPEDAALKPLPCIGFPNIIFHFLQTPWAPSCFSNTKIKGCLRTV